MMFLRLTGFIVLLSQFAVAPSTSAPKPPFLVVEATSNVANDIAAALNVRDLEHFVVAELIRQRVEMAVPSSSAEDLQTSEAPAVYVLTLSIEQLEEAWQPQWNWTEHRYVDDEVLHLEVSLTLTHTQDDATIGGLYDIHDYRAEDFGSFSRPQAVRAVVYEAATKLTDEFASGASSGEFGEALRSIQRPGTPADLLHDWNELSSDWKIWSVIAAAFALLLLVGLLIRILLFASRLVYHVLVPSAFRLAPGYPPLPVMQPLQPRQRRKSDVKPQLYVPSAEGTSEENNRGEDNGDEESGEEDLDDFESEQAR